MPPAQQPATASEWWSEIAHKVASGAGLALVVAAIGWAVNVDRTQQQTLHEMSTQTAKLVEISRQLETMNTLDKRVAHIESTRFTRERGEELERRLIVLESQVAELEKRRR
jgi:hypothetical protein